MADYWVCLADPGRYPPSHPQPTSSAGHLPSRSKTEYGARSSEVAGVFRKNVLSGSGKNEGEGQGEE